MEPDEIAEDTEAETADETEEAEEGSHRATRDDVPGHRARSLSGSSGHERSLFRPPTVRDGDAAFSLVHLRESVDGRVYARVQRKLTTKVYKKATAERLARYEARQMEDDKSILVLVRPSGSTVGGWISGTGKKVPARVMGRARKFLRELMPELFPASVRRKTRKQRRRRTSRAPRQPTRRRRTSRRVG